MTLPPPYQKTVEQAFMDHMGDSVFTSVMTTSTVEPVGEVLGMKVFESPYMPDGWVGLDTDRAIIAIGPDGAITIPKMTIENIPIEVKL